MLSTSSLICVSGGEKFEIFGFCINPLCLCPYANSGCQHCQLQHTASCYAIITGTYFCVLFAEVNFLKFMCHLSHSQTPPCFSLYRNILRRNLVLKSEIYGLNQTQKKVSQVSAFHLASSIPSYVSLLKNSCCLHHKLNVVFLSSVLALIFPLLVQLLRNC